MRKYRNLYIALFFLAIISFTIPLVIFNIKNRNPDLYSIRIEGNVSEKVEYTYEEVIDGEFGLVEDQKFTYLNQPPYNTRFEAVYSGVSLWTLLTHTTIMYPNSTAVYFKSYDSYYTEEISLEKIENNPNGVIIAFKKGNDVLKYNSEEGGPFRAIVNLSVTEPDYCSKFWAKHVNTVVIV